MSIKGDTEPNIQIVSYQDLKIATSATFSPSTLPPMKTSEGSCSGLLGLKLGENWIFIFWLVGRVKSGRSNGFIHPVGS